MVTGKGDSTAKNYLALLQKLDVLNANLNSAQYHFKWCGAKLGGERSADL